MTYSLKSMVALSQLLILAYLKKSIIFTVMYIGFA